MSSSSRDDYDSPWKDALQRYLRPFLELFFPTVAVAVDWEAGYAPLDTGLRGSDRQAAIGKGAADALFALQLLDGTKARVLIHLEVQSQRDAEFTHRMFFYHYRFHDRHRLPLCSLAVLADASADWRPDHYEHELWGCRCRLDFPVVKLRDFRPRLDELEQSSNPFAVFVAAHLRAQETRAPQRRLAHLRRILPALYHRGFNRQDVVELIRLVRWVLALPEAMATIFHGELIEYEKELGMPFLSDFEVWAEERGYKKGQEEATRETLCTVLAARFGTVPDTVTEELRRIGDLATLRSLTARAALVGSLEEFVASLP